MSYHPLMKRVIFDMFEEYVEDMCGFHEQRLMTTHDNLVVHGMIA